MTVQADPAIGRRRIIAFAVLMAALTVLFAGLGFWQWQRLGEKQRMIAAIETRVSLQPTTLPPAAAWPALDAQSFDYRPVVLTGTLHHDQSVLVFTSLGSDARGLHSGPGYWVMTPLTLPEGGAVFVNRGFLPEAVAEPSVHSDAPDEAATVIGLARLPEAGNAFTPPPDPTRRVDWLRSIERLAAMVDPAFAPFAPVYVDAAAGRLAALPQGGETILAIPNRHLDYLLTWFALAALTPVLFGVWLWRNWRSTKPS